MPQPLDTALAEVRSLLLGPGLTRAVAAGRRRGQAPSVVRAELRPVTLKSGVRLQIATFDGARPHTRNVPSGPEADAAVDALLAEPFGNWHVETATATVQLRVTKKGDAQLHRATTEPRPTVAAGHDRTREHLLDPGDPLFAVIGGTAAKRRQVDAFLRALAATLPDQLPDRLRVVDLGCGNAYLTFAAYRYLSGRGLDVEIVGVDVRDDQRRRNTELAERLGCADRVGFVAGTNLDAPVRPPSTWYWPCTPATPPPTRRSPGRCGGTRAGCSPPRAATTTWRHSCGTGPPRSRTSCSPGRASCASGSPTCSPTRCGRRCCGCAATGSTWWSSSTPRTRHATCCCGPG
ncbi:methyltransferase [Micromonospora zhanjiangensis]